MSKRELPAYTAVIQQYYPGRYKYTYEILEALARSSHKPKSAILWYNYNHLDFMDHLGYFEPPEVIDGIKIEVIRSDSNVMIGRYLAAMAAETDYVLIQDDDLVVQERTAERLIEVAAISSIQVGNEGRNLARQALNPYTGGEGVYREIGRLKTADVVSRIWMAHKKAMVNGLKLIASGELREFNEYPLKRCEDMIFSLANSGALVAPDKGEGSRIVNLDEEGIGMSHDKKHMEERDRGARMIIKALQELQVVGGSKW